jgi:hypothetical protein
MIFVTAYWSKDNGQNNPFKLWRIIYWNMFDFNVFCLICSLLQVQPNLYNMPVSIELSVMYTSSYVVSHKSFTEFEW